MERFEGNLENEELEFQKKEMAISTEKHIDEVAEHAAMYFPDGIKKHYSEKLNELHSELLEIQHYLLAKKLHPTLAKELSDILTRKPVSGIQKERKESELQECEQLIESFEKEGVPEEVFAKAKASISELSHIVGQLSNIKEVAMYTPERN